MLKVRDKTVRKFEIRTFSPVFFADFFNYDIIIYIFNKIISIFKFIILTILTRSADFKIGCYDISRNGCIYCKRFHSSDTTFNLTVSMEQCEASELEKWTNFKDDIFKSGICQ